MKKIEPNKMKKLTIVESLFLFVRGFILVTALSVISSILDNSDIWETVKRVDIIYTILFVLFLCVVLGFQYYMSKNMN